VKIAGLDIGFSARRRSAGVGVFDGKQIKLTVPSKTGLSC
jgi:hypothetical protein